MSSFWQPSAYLTVVVLGIFNLFISYNWLVETKGINLDRVEIKDDTEDAEPEEQVKMLNDKSKA